MSIISYIRYNNVTFSVTMLIIDVLLNFTN